MDKVFWLILGLFGNPILFLVYSNPTYDQKSWHPRPVAYPLAFLSRRREPSINFPSTPAPGKTARLQHSDIRPNLCHPQNPLLPLLIVVFCFSLGENSVVVVISGANSTTQGLAEAVSELARQKVSLSLHSLYVAS